MSSDEEKLKSIKTEIRSLIVSSPVGLTIEKFLRDYKECMGFTLPFTDFGHKNAQDFLNSLPDVVQLKNTASGILLVPVENKLVSHISDLVSKQRSTRKNGTFEPRMTTVDTRRYYQLVNRKNTKRRPKKGYNIKSEGLHSSDSSSALDDIDNLHIDWTTEYRTKHFSNIMGYGRTKDFSPPRRPSPISTHEHNLLETIRIPQTISCKEYDHHENGDECGTSQFYAVNKTSCCSPGNLPSLDSESGVASDHSSLDYESGCNSTSRSSDNESSVSIFDKYGQMLHYRPVGRSSYCEKDYMDTPFQLQPNSTRISDTTITLNEHNKKSSKICKNGKIGNDIYISNEHEIYLTAFAHGIVLDPSKVIEPYKHLLNLVQSPKVRNDVDINLFQNLKIRDDVDINLTQTPQIRNINSSSTPLKECGLNIGSDVKDKCAANNNVINSLNFGRCSEFKNSLKFNQEGKSNVLGDLSSSTNNQRGGIGRGHFLKVMQKKYFQVY